MHLRRIFLWSMVGSIGLAALLGIAAVVLPRYRPNGQLLGSSALFACFSLVSLSCAAVLEKRRLVPYMWAGLGIAASALAAWLALLWFEPFLDRPAQEAIAQIAATLTVLSILTAQFGLLCVPRFHDRRADLVRWATAVASGLLALHVVVLVWWWQPLGRVIDDDLLVKMLVVLAILSSCGTVVTPILWKVQSEPAPASEGAMPLKVRIGMTCPRCRTAQDVANGPGRCGACGLRITIDVEEPRCRCGYLLFRLESDQCPECGRRIAETDRWAA